ncbi:stalk domain-containing protein [Herbiconiux sp.]|uniref:stalk domain-containing protein n=1 Tax=Herbiconiux sp. TaxID=1871186 RepID=UPI0025B82FC1|nr:stalk domain-containing protein [Herbiconiux sp.]
MHDAVDPDAVPSAQSEWLMEPVPGRGISRRSFLSIAAAASAVSGLLLMDKPGQASAHPLPAAFVRDTSGSAGTARYLVEEDFHMPNAVTDPILIVPSGWDVRQAGGSFTFAYGRWAKVTDSGGLPVVMQRRFTAHEAGVLTVDFRFEPLTALNGVTWTVGTTGANAVVLTADAGQLSVQTPTGAQALASLTVGTPVGVRVILDLDAGQFTVSVNGATATAAIPFAQAATVLDLFTIQTSEAFVGNFYIDTVRIHRGFVVNESFVTVPSGLPADWAAAGAGAVFSIAELHGSSYADRYSLLVNTLAATAPATFQRTFTALTDDLTFEFRFLAPSGAQNVSAVLSEGTQPGLQIGASAGSITYADASGAPVVCYDCKPNLWYHVRVTTDAANNQATIVVNGKTAASGVAIPAVTAVDTLTFGVGAGPSGKVYLDDIRLSVTPPDPTDYVPTPVPLDTGDYLVGVQTFAGWREGHHQGWDALSPYPSRKPLLGWYDEGDPEVTDWGIKWMVENGISFELACWFRPLDGVGQPIKVPDLGHHLHQGLFTSRYKSLVKFAIMYENISSGATNSSDFRTVMVPYWIEYYFRDPSYLVIDNKPVFSIYSIPKLITTFGSAAAAAAEVAYLRTAVQAAGFDDLIIIAPQVDANAPTVGVDAQYKYSVGAVAALTEGYRQNLLTWRGNAVVDVVPTISMGQDQLPWNLTPGAWASVTDFEANATWVRDDFMPALPTSSLGRSMVLVDNWNEFGEGHFVMPSALAGFGYVNAVANVFGSATPGANVTPTTAQAERLGLLYPADRTQPLKELPAPAKPDDYWTRWTFDTDGDVEGWTNSENNQVTNIQVQDGVLTATSIGTDPGLVSPDHLGIDANRAPWVRIRMKSDTPPEYFYFITEADSTWSQDKGAQVIVDSYNDEFGVGYIAAWGNAKWVGTIRQIRIDMMSTPGDFTIDEIGVVKVPLTPPALLVGGKYSRTAVPLLAPNGTPMVPAAYVVEATGGRPEWRPDTQWFVARHTGTTLIAQVASSSAHAGATVIHLDAPCLWVGGRFYIAATFFQQALGYTVTWDATAQLLTITP